MSITARIFAIVFLALAAVIGAALFFYFVIFDAEFVIRRAQKIVREKTGRELIVDGDAVLRKGWVTYIHVEGLHFENPDWADRQYTMEADEVELNVRLWSLLFGPAVVEDALIVRPRVFLEKNESGEGNWKFLGGDEDDIVPDKRSSLPKIKMLRSVDGEFHYRGRTGRRTVDLLFTELTSQIRGEKAIETRMSGSFQGDPFRLSLETAPWRKLSQAGKPYPVKAALRLGDLKVRADGAIADPLKLRALDFAMTISGANMAKLYDYTLIALPETPAYELSGRFLREDGVWRYENFAGTVGESDLSGSLAVEVKDGRPTLSGDIRSERLHLVDIGGLFGLDFSEIKSDEKEKKDNDPETDEKRLPLGFISDKTIDLSRLNAMDAAVNLEASEFVAKDSLFDETSARITLQDGVLTFDPFAFKTGAGSVLFNLTLNGAHSPISVDVETIGRNVPMSRLLGEGADETAGPLSGHLALTARGQSPLELVKDATGDGLLVMDGGVVSHLLIELIGLDIAETLGIVFSGDEPIPVRCAVVDMAAAGGLIASRQMFFDTKDTIIVGDGEVDLAAERMTVALWPSPKDVSPLTFKTKISIEGPLDDIEIFPDPLGVGSEGFFEKVVNAIATPVLGVLPPFDDGSGKDANCRASLAAAQEEMSP